MEGKLMHVLFLTGQQREALRMLIHLEMVSSESRRIVAWRELVAPFEQLNSGEPAQLHVVLQRHREDDIAIEVGSVVGPFVACDAANAWIATQPADDEVEYEAVSVEEPGDVAPAAPAPKPIYVVHISHKYGDDLSTFDTHEAARASVAEYARQWWEKEGVPGPAPDDDDAAISAYFEHANGWESYTIEQTTLNIAA
jgi:hypothetical protein